MGGRRLLVGAGLLGLAAAPLLVARQLGLDPRTAAALGSGGLRAAVDSVGWVLLPQLALGVAIVGLGLERLAASAAGASTRPDPRWLAPAIESALLLGMLGTLSGMLHGFVGLSPDELEPGPLVHSLGTALRSSFVGFLIALIGVWVRSSVWVRSAVRVRGAAPSGSPSAGGLGA